MIIFTLNNQNETGTHINISEVKTGERYHINGMTEKEEYRGKVNTYFNEYVYRNKEAYLMTRADGTKPFAVATNDCERDGFKPFHLSRIFVDVGHHIIYAYHEKDAKSYDPVKFLIFKVMNLNPKSDHQNIIEVELMHQFDSIGIIPAKFEEIVDHAIKVFSSDLKEQLLPKFCFNTNRAISLRLLERNDQNEIYTRFGNGQKLILNANSKSRIVDGEVVNGGLFRVFFSRKFKDSKVVYVDGTQLTPLRKWDIDKYIEQSFLDEDVARATIREIRTRGGNRFYATSTLNEDIRPIYKSVDGYSSFSLSIYEKQNITEVRDIKEWI